ncbi:MAG TPA: hypothetical protein VIT43_02605 [Candidatus Dormibacteraeota bacterium]
MATTVKTFGSRRSTEDRLDIVWLVVCTLAAIAAIPFIVIQQPKAALYLLLVAASLSLPDFRRLRQLIIDRPVLSPASVGRYSIGYFLLGFLLIITSLFTPPAQRADVTVSAALFALYDLIRGVFFVRAIVTDRQRTHQGDRPAGKRQDY